MGDYRESYQDDTGKRAQGQKVNDLKQWKERLQQFGVIEIEYDDPSRFADPVRTSSFRHQAGRYSA